MCFTRAKKKGRTTSSLNLWRMLCLMQLRVLLAFYASKGTLLTHVQLVYQDPQVLFYKVAFQLVSSSLYWCVGLFLLKHGTLYSLAYECPSE